MAYVQRIGYHNLAVPPSLQVVSLHSTYLFNVGENSQRFRFEHGLSIGKICNIFLTDTSTSCIDGLIGLMFALEGTMIQRLTVFGPPSIKEIMHNIGHFYLEPCKYEICSREIVEVGFNELLKENGITIYGTCIPRAAAHVDAATTYSSSSYSCGYIIKCDDCRGTFRPQEAIALGVKKGPAFALLKSGQAVQIEGGSWVQPSQVCGDPIKGKCFAVFHDNTPAALEMVKQALRLHENMDYLFFMRTIKGQNTGLDELEDITVVACDTPTVEADKYVMFPTAYRRNSILHAYAPQLYPSLSRRKAKSVNSESCSKATVTSFSETKEVFSPLSKLVLTPPTKAQFNSDVSLKFEMQEDYSATSMEMAGFFMPMLDESLMGNPSMTFLGTGCSAPSPLRNVSGILLQLSDDFSMLLDAGEGTLQQIFLLSKSFEDFIDTIRTIKIAFISHSHADHHLGLYSILAFQKLYMMDMDKGTDERKTVVIAPNETLKWMEFYKHNISPMDFNGLSSSIDTHYETVVNGSTLSLELIEVEHIHDSVGVKVTHQEIGTLVYSGDTRPCPGIIKAAMGCDILIHEASFNDEEREEALRRCHTTFTEALGLAETCKVGTLILTHFSQRYQTIDLEPFKSAENVILAEDLLRLPIKALTQICVPHMKALQRMNDIINMTPS